MNAAASPEARYWASESINTAEALCAASTDASRHRRRIAARQRRLRLYCTFAALTALPFALSGLPL